jgi:hypothetical protein
MVDTFKSSPEDALREEARQALQTFEHILEIMPDDQGTLEAVIMAAEQCGEREKAMNARMRLVEALLVQDEHELAGEHLEVMRASEDPAVQAWLVAHDQKQRQAPAAGPAAPTSKAAPETTAAKPSRAAKTIPVKADISGEIDLAWKLMEAEKISQEEYASLVKDLTEMSASPRLDTVSVLHALEAGHHKNLEGILAFISQAARAPYVAPSCFTMRAELLPFLPDNFIIARGAIIFDMMGKELLVALLNPFNTSTRHEVEQLTGRTCHFYLTRASEFDLAHKRLKDSAEDA